jgi:hypothetical protein
LKNPEKEDLKLAYLEDTGMINDQSIGDDEVERVGIRLIGSLSLTVSKRLSSAEFTLVWGNVSSKVSTASDRGMRDSERTSVNREIVFHLDPKTCISQPGIETRVSAFAHDQKEVEEAPNPISCRRSIH